MSAIHVVVRPSSPHLSSTPLAPLHGLFDVIVDGVNVTARLGEGQALALLAELAHGVAVLSSGRRSRTTLQLYAEDRAWELGLEADGSDVLLSVYSTGGMPEVAVFERRASLASLAESVLHALDGVPAAEDSALAAQLVVARTALSAALPVSERPTVRRVAARVSSRGSGGFALGGEAEFRRTPYEAEILDPQLEKSDLHALLLRGTMRVASKSRELCLSGVHLFLVVERMMQLAEEVLDAWQAERPVFRRVESGGVRLSVRRGPADPKIALSVRAAGKIAEESGLTLPEIEPASFVRGVLRFARGLGDALVKHDPSQARNLRLNGMLGQAASLGERLEDAVSDDSRSNPEPDSYRSFSVPRPVSEGRGTWEHGGKMRFLPRWVATVPNIDLAATFLCGDNLIVGSARETASIQRSSGQVNWRIPTARAGSVVTPVGLCRLHPDGRLMLHELESGERRFTTTLTPRAAGGASGAVIHAPGLPKLLVVAEGDRQITAIDLVSGDVRWRHTARRPAAYRLRRAGKLLLLAGDSALVALDVASGELVWRLRDRLPFTGDICIDHDSAFAIGRLPNGPARLHHLDPFSGVLFWSAALDDRPVPGQAPMLTPEAVVVPTRDRRGSGARAFDRRSGRMLWEHAPGLCAPTTAWLAVDDAIIANSAAGTLLALDACSGTLRFNHVFSRHVEADQPRRLEPVLRNGALFVPQHQVHVVRPGDGEIIGTVPTDLIPDLLRVDERCEVYLAEESGHLAAFGAAPRLALVR